MAKAKTKAKAKAKTKLQKQATLPGQEELPKTERPSIAELDVGVRDWLDAKDDAKTAKETEKSKREEATEIMRAFEGDLEKDSNGNPAYVYRDDYRELSVALSSSSKLVTALLDD